MRISLFIYLSLALPLSACTMSELDPGDDVQVVGMAMDGQGNPMDGQRVVLAKEPDLGEVLGGIILGPVTVLGCLSDDPPAICEGARVMATDDSGHFAFSLKGRDTQGSIGNASFFNLGTQIEARGDELDGPSTMQRFVIQRELLDVPGLRLWDPAFAIDAGDEEILVSFDQALAADASIRFEAQSGAAWNPSVWVVEDFDGSPIDARLVEDAVVGVVAMRDTQESSDGESFDILYRSGKIAFEGTAGAPPSRGARCYAHTAEGSAQEISPCELTDGDLTSSFEPLEDAECPEDQPECEPARANHFAYVDLGSDTPLSFVVARGGFYSARLEVSDDGQNWQTVSAPQTGSFALDMPAGSSARYVRLVGADPEDDVVGLAELSVW